MEKNADLVSRIGQSLIKHGKLKSSIVCCIGCIFISVSFTTGLMYAISMPNIGFGIAVSFAMPLVISFPTFYMTFSLILRLHAAEQKLQDLANHDPMTKLPNRRYLYSFAENLLRRSRRNKTSIGVMIMDVDHFKKYNDFYGHEAGDHCLIQVASAIGALAKRPEDMAARYGGEEFVFLVGDTDFKGTIAVAEEICKAVYGLKIPHEKSDTADYVSLSIGVYHTTVEADTNLDNMIAFADQRLYQAKEKGRNQVIYA